MIKTDKQLKNELLDQIRRDDRVVDGADVNVDVKSGSVRVCGIVPDKACEDTVLEIICNFEGVYSIKNRIMIIEPLEPLDDVETRANVEKVLEIDPLIDSNDIFVTVKDESAVLEGFVPNDWQKLRAEMRTENMAGVNNCVNKLSVDSTR